MISTIVAIKTANESNEYTLAIDLINDFRIIKSGYIIFLSKKGVNGIYNRVDAFPAIGKITNGLEKFSHEDASYIANERAEKIMNISNTWESIVRKG